VDNIYEHGLINQISVALFKQDECLRHIKNINKVFKEHTSIDSLRTYYGYYPVLIAGERRLRAVKKLQNLYPKEVKRIPATIYRDLTSEDAVNLQASENTYQPPPPEDKYTFPLCCEQGGNYLGTCVPKVLAGESAEQLGYDDACSDLGTEADVVCAAPTGAASAPRRRRARRRRPA